MTVCVSRGKLPLLRLPVRFCLSVLFLVAGVSPSMATIHYVRTHNGAVVHYKTVSSSDVGTKMIANMEIKVPSYAPEYRTTGISSVLVYETLPVDLSKNVWRTGNFLGFHIIEMKDRGGGSYDVIVDIYCKGKGKGGAIEDTHGIVTTKLVAGISCDLLGS